MRSSSSEPAGSGPRAEGEPPRLAQDGDVARVEPRLVGTDGSHADRDGVGACTQLVDAPAGLLAGHPA